MKKKNNFISLENFTDINDEEILEESESLEAWHQRQADFEKERKERNDLRMKVFRDLDETGILKSKLTAKQYEIVRLMVYQNLDEKSIANALKISAQAVCTHLTRSAKKLKKLVNSL